MSATRSTTRPSTCSTAPERLQADPAGLAAKMAGLLEVNPLGMVAADALAIVVGRALGKGLPEKTIRIGASALFFIFGIWLTIEAITQLA
jgi:putative Ca2+/H+ antiporter (TMEM165/GDT1 family)